MAVQFQTTLEGAKRTATGFVVPPELLEQLGGGRRPKIVVTIGDHRYRSSVGSMNGVAMVPVSAEQRAAAGIEAGDALDVTLALDDAPRKVEVPDVLAEALAADAKAKTFFDSLSYSNQRWHVLAIEGARREATRRRRLEKSLAMLREGRRP